MFSRFLTVGGFTLLSRVTGFLRDIVMAAVLGAGPLADAFLVAFRLPNHFRAIFAEGAFASAFVPAYARVRTQNGADSARLFSDRIFTLLLISQIALLALALAFTPGVIALLAPGFADDPLRFSLATELTRITFPYLLLMTLVTLYSDILNSLDRFASAAAAPVFLNLSMIFALSLAMFFPTAGHAAAWGVLLAGFLEALLVGSDVRRAGALPRLRRPTWDDDIKRFFKALGPATVGSAGVQLALFADTIIASFLAAGALSALYYADRLNQLPIGVIGIAVGTVLLPDMARRVAQGDLAGARDAQNRAFEFALLLVIPCVVAFVLIPDLIMRALFARGAFTAADARAAAATLTAYTLGLIPFVLMRSAVAPFFARGDTFTPVKASLIAASVNIGFKFVLVGPLAQVGLAVATAIGGWVNFALLMWLARREGLTEADARLRVSMAKLAGAGAILGAGLWFAATPIRGVFADTRAFRDELALATLIVLSTLLYFGAVLALLGGKWFAAFKGRSGGGAVIAPD